MRVKLKNYSNYISPVRYLSRILYFFNNTLLQYWDIHTAPVYKTTFKYPPIFIIGAPRCGSTLIFQVITDAFDVAYLSNRHCRFSGSPALAERLFHPLRDKVPSDYDSHHGQTKGSSAPSECGEWWYRFFRREPVYVTLADVDEKKMRNFRRSLLALSESTNKPLVFKNLYASLRLEAIAKYVPEALFVFIQRGEFDNAHSILEGRMKTQNNYRQWWSVPPRNIEQLKLLEPAQQVVEQIRAVHNEVNQAVKDGFIDSNRVHTMQYEKFCDNVHNSLYELEKFFLTHGLNISRKFSVPEKFSINKSIRIESGLYSELQMIAQS